MVICETRGRGTLIGVRFTGCPGEEGDTCGGSVTPEGGKSRKMGDFPTCGRNEEGDTCGGSVTPNGCECIKNGIILGCSSGEVGDTCGGSVTPNAGKGCKTRDRLMCRRGEEGDTRVQGLRPRSRPGLGQALRFCLYLRHQNIGCKVCFLGLGLAWAWFSAVAQFKTPKPRLQGLLPRSGLGRGLGLSFCLFQGTKPRLQGLHPRSGPGLGLVLCLC